MLSFIVFLFGLAVGSFLNSVIFRMEKGESAFHGRSYCPHCKHSLSWYDLIPLVSFFLLRGKCRYCPSSGDVPKGHKGNISFQYPIVELATAILFVAIFSLVQTKSDLVIHSLVGLSFAYLLLIGCLLVIIFVYDLKHYLIPDKIVYSAIGLALLWDLFRLPAGQAGILDFGLAILPAFVFLAIVLVSKETWMGMGDAKLALFMGLFLGWPNVLVALFAAFLLGAAVGISLILLKTKQLSSRVPFGPFLIAGTFVALFFGDSLVDLYISLMVY